VKRVKEPLSSIKQRVQGHLHVIVYVVIMVVACLMVMSCSEDAQEEVEFVEEFNARNRYDDPDFAKRFEVIKSLQIELVVWNKTYDSAKLLTVIDDTSVWLMSYHQNDGYQMIFFSTKEKLNAFTEHLRQCLDNVRRRGHSPFDSFNDNRRRRGERIEFYKYKTLDDPGGILIEGRKYASSKRYEECYISIMDHRERTPERREVRQWVLSSLKTRKLLEHLAEALKRLDED